MKEERVSDRQREDDEEKIDVQELLFKYIIHFNYIVTPKNRNFKILCTSGRLVSVKIHNI